MSKNRFAYGKGFEGNGVSMTMPVKLQTSILVPKIVLILSFSLGNLSGPWHLHLDAQQHLNFSDGV